MSTFKGKIKEFPDISVDYFRVVPGQRPPLACFLSHVHSDHLQGLETLKSPFVYCSAATRQLLLCLERYSHRMNFARGILEVRKQHYGHLKGLLKPLLVDTPTRIELGPQRFIQVTLFDANHCAGAVMFLIEDAALAILYTGDIRAEPWWVNSIARNSVIIPFTCKQRRLENVYLDTTFVAMENIDEVFPTKAEGLTDLLQQISAYPDDTLFYFNAWTLGYEEVWITLSLALNSQIHVDEYKMRLNESLLKVHKNDVLAQHVHALSGFQCGNRYQPGILTSNFEVRIHSCEKGTSCEYLDSASVVHIIPTVALSKCGSYIPEIGATAANNVTHDYQFETGDKNIGIEFKKLCSEIKKEEQTIVRDAERSSMNLSPANHKLNDNLRDTVSSKILAEPVPKGALAEYSETPKRETSPTKMVKDHKVPKVQKPGQDKHQLPDQIYFPYSRHSSYHESCHLVRILNPVDVYPCTIDESQWDGGLNMKSLFGHLCAGTTFSYDQERLALNTQPRAEEESMEESNSWVNAMDLPERNTSLKQASGCIDSASATDSNYETASEYGGSHGTGVSHFTKAIMDGQPPQGSAPSTGSFYRESRMNEIRTLFEARLYRDGEKFS